MARYRHDKPKPVGTIVGVILCLGAIGGFLILISTGVIKFGTDKNKQTLPPASTGGPATRPTTPTTTNGSSTVAPTTGPTATGEVRVHFNGSFSAKGDTRKIVYKCPHCQKDIVDVRVPKCPNCAKSITWPTKVVCKFCSGSGKCPYCKGTGKCQECSKGHRMLMGVKPPCDACNTTGKCQACLESRTCTFCEGGNFYPGKPKSAKKPTAEEAPPIPKPKPE